jgi:hypothetical protein
MKRITVLVAATLVLSFFSVGSAKADSVGTLALTNCGSSSTGCPAATYSFDVTNTTATLTITISGTPTSNNDYITAVDLGITSASNPVTGLILAEAPTLPGSDTWNITSAGALTSGGTCGTGSGGFICADSTPTDALGISAGNQYTWEWTFNSLPSVFAPDQVHIGAEYGPNAADNNKGLIVSQTIATPEPSSLALLSIGLIGLFGLALKKSNARV